MSVEWKICKNCHHKVNITAKKCPYCNNDLFEDIEDKSGFCPIWYWCLVFVDDYTSIYPPDVVECYSDE